MYLEYNYKFECDDKIAPYIVMLNNKGYMTDYCCEGHEEGETISVDSDGKTSVVIEKVYSGPYILFSRISSFDISYMNLGCPENWRIEKTYSEEFKIVMKYCIRRKFSDEEIKNNSMNELVDISMKELSKWVDSLPINSYSQILDDNNEILKIYKGDK